VDRAVEIGQPDRTGSDQLVEGEGDSKVSIGAHEDGCHRGGDIHKEEQICWGEIRFNSVREWGGAVGHS
jgi:hypothetical protein